MSAEIDYCYDVDDWEYTCAWSDRDNLLEDAHKHKILTVGTLIKGPERFAAYVVTKFDDEGDEINGEWQWFDSEAEARAARLAESPAP